MLLERDRLTSGTTWHAAGLMVTFGSTSETSTEMRKYTRDLYARLEAETGPGDRLQAGRVHRGRHRRRTGSRSTAASRPSTATAASTCTRSRRARSASCSRWRAPTTCSPASTSPRTAGPTRSTSRWRWPRARGMQGATIVEGVAGHRRAAPSDGAVTGVRTAHGDIEAEYVVNCAGMWARQLGAQVRRQHPAAGRRALLPDHRARSPGCRRDWPVLEDPASLRLLPRGGRRPDGRPVRAGLRAVEGRAASPTTSRSASCRPTGTAWARTSRRRWRRVPDLAGGRHPQVLLRPGELHARPAAGRRRGARAEELLRRRRAELDRHPHRRRPRPRARALDRRRPRPTSTSPASTSTGCTRYQANPEYRRDPHGRVARHGLPVPLPDAVDADRARREDVADPRPAGRAAARTSATSAAGRAPTGTRPPGVEPDRRAAVVGPAELVPATGRPSTTPRARASIVMDMSFMAKFLVQGRDAGRLLDQISANDVDGEPGRHHLHAVAQRGRHARGRPHGHQARRRALLGGRLRHRAPARRDLDAAAHRRRARVRHRRDVGLRADQRAGPALARAAAVAHRRPTCPTRRSRSARRARSTSASRGCSACASPTSASSATSSTSRPSRRPHVYDRLVAAGAARRAAARRAQGAGQPADGEGLPRLRPRHRQHRLGARGRARLRGRPGQAGRLHRPRRGAGQEGRGPADAAAGAGAAERPGAVAVPRRGGAARRRGRSATSAPRRTATRSAAPSGWRWSSAGEPVDAGLARRRRVGGRHRRATLRRRSRRCGRCTTRRTSASGPDVVSERSLQTSWSW